jgi:malate dehydrogenase (oxaloacetate-decarboxylating)
MTLPILLDTGTDNRERLTDPFISDGGTSACAVPITMTSSSNSSLPWNGAGRMYAAVGRLRPGQCRAHYRDRLCTFNHDIQGTAAVAAGTLLGATRVTGTALRDQTFGLIGAGTAGCGIGHLLLKLMVDDGLPEAEARQRFFAVDCDGLLVEGMTGLQPFQAPFVQPRAGVAD